MATSFQLQVVQTMIERNLSITAAESLTAGLFQSTLGDVAGVSTIFPGGFVTYANEVKHQLVNVPETIIANDGVVSKATAIAMATGAKRQLQTSIAVSFTGVAGPDALEGNPAGTVWIGIDFASYMPTAKVYHFNGDREAVRRQSVATAFEMIAQYLN